MAGALATPAMGRLADGPRKRRVIEVALRRGLAGCVLSAVSSSFAVLVIGRGLQGVGLGLLPVTMAIARSQFSPDEAGRAIATLSVSAAVGAGLGYPITSLIAQLLDYRAAFWFGAITVATALALVVIVLPGGRTAAPDDSTGSGMATLGAAVVGVSVVLSEGGGWGWTSLRSLVLVAFSVPWWASGSCTSSGSPTRSSTSGRYGTDRSSPPTCPPSSSPRPCISSFPSSSSSCRSRWPAATGSAPPSWCRGWCSSPCRSGRSWPAGA